MALSTSLAFTSVCSCSLTVKLRAPGSRRARPRSRSGRAERRREGGKEERTNSSNSAAFSATLVSTRVALMSSTVALVGDKERLLVRISTFLALRSRLRTTQSSKAVFLFKSRDWETITSLTGAQAGVLLWMNLPYVAKERLTTDVEANILWLFNVNVNYALVRVIFFLVVLDSYYHSKPDSTYYVVDSLKPVYWKVG